MAQSKPSSDVYQLKVTLQGIRPQIWRRFQVTGDTTLPELHLILQVVMGWENYHLHQFSIGGPDPDFGSETKNDHKVTLRQLVPQEKTRFAYEYDFGDSWEHEILVEKILPRKPRARYPVCVAGKRACPPEDCGGIWGYPEFLKAIRNRRHPEHREMLEWIGGSFDPEAFDLKEINRALRAIG